MALNMGNMFRNCTSLTSLDLSNFLTTSVSSMTGMFKGCSKLQTLNIKFNTQKVNNIAEMFAGCEKLESLDLSTFDTRKCLDYDNVFDGCGNLEVVIDKDLNSDFISTFPENVHVKE